MPRMLPALIVLSCLLPRWALADQAVDMGHPVLFGVNTTPAAVTVTTVTAAQPATGDTAATPPPATTEGAAAASTTGLVMAMDRLLPGANESRIRPLVQAEARAILSLYLAGTIREWYFRQDRPGAVFILDTDEANARRLLDELPLVKAGLVGFDIIPIGPYIPLAALLQREVPIKHGRREK